MNGKIDIKKDVRAPRPYTLNIPAGRLHLQGDLSLPENAKGLVIFAHGSGSSRFSPRNRYVAGRLNESGFGALLTDLLTPEEEEVDNRTRRLRFDIALLANRLEHIIGWASNYSEIKNLPVGLFGASTGAAAALIAAARQSNKVGAVVSRGGRPDLAAQLLSFVRAPTLLIVGEHDPEVLELNRVALVRLNRESKLDIVPRAGHLFEEPGTLDAAAALAADWFDQHLGDSHVS